MCWESWRKIVGIFFKDPYCFCVFLRVHLLDHLRLWFLQHVLFFLQLALFSHSVLQTSCMSRQMAHVAASENKRTWACTRRCENACTGVAVAPKPIEAVHIAVITKLCNYDFTSVQEMLHMLLPWTGLTLAFSVDGGKGEPENKHRRSFPSPPVFFIYTSPSAMACKHRSLLTIWCLHLYS